METPDAPSPRILLGLLAEFHEEVVRIRQEAAAGTLPRHLAAAGGPVPAKPEELAAAISTRLANLLHELDRRMRTEATESQQRAAETATYLMAALADEIFLFDPEWRSRMSWLPHLLEQRLFQTRIAGRRFFDCAEAVLQAPVRDALQRDLASCFLLALQLGFHGVHGGASGAPALAALRERLWRFVHGAADHAWPQQLFPQAGEHTVISSRDERIAPIEPWLRAARWWIAGFVLVSSLAWLVLVQPLLRGPGS